MKSALNHKQVRKNDTLRDVMLKIEQGQISSISENITFNLSELKPKDVLALLEIIRLKSFGPSYINNLEKRIAGFVTEQMTDVQLSCARIESGDFDAVTKLEIREAPTEDPELVVQRVRAYCFSGNFVSGLQELLQLMKRPELYVSTRGVCHQLMAQCYLELGNFNLAHENLKLSLNLAELVGNRLGVLATHLFFAKTGCLVDDVPLANNHFVLALNHVAKNNENFRWLLGIYRTYGFTLFSAARSNCFEKMTIAILLSKSIGDPVYTAKNCVELLFMAKATRAPLSKELETSLISKVKEGILASNDIAVWLNALYAETEREIWPESLKYLFRKMKKGQNESKEWSNHQSVYENFQWLHRYLAEEISANWIMDSDLGFLISLSNQNHAAVKINSPMIRLIEFLAAQSSPVNIETCFEEAWGLKWNEEIHKNTVAVTLNRINQRLGDYKVRRHEGRLSIDEPGLVSRTLTHQTDECGSAY